MKIRGNAQSLAWCKRGFKLSIHQVWLHPWYAVICIISLTYILLTLAVVTADCELIKYWKWAACDKVKWDFNLKCWRVSTTRKINFSTLKTTNLTFFYTENWVHKLVYYGVRNKLHARQSTSAPTLPWRFWESQNIRSPIFLFKKLTRDYIVELVWMFFK